MIIEKYCKNSAQYCAILQYFSIIAQKTSAILQYFSIIALKYCNNSEKYWLILCYQLRPYCPTSFNRAANQQGLSASHFFALPGGSQLVLCWPPYFARKMALLKSYLPSHAKFKPLFISICKSDVIDMLLSLKTKGNISVFDHDLMLI